MRLIWIRDPWVSLIESGAKAVEMRSWSTDYRGRVLICSSASGESIDLEPGEPALPTGPLGVTRCLVELTDCRPLAAEDLPRAMPMPWWDFSAGHEEPSGFGWHLRLLHTVERLPVRGSLGLVTSGAVLRRHPFRPDLAALLNRLAA